MDDLNQAMRMIHWLEEERRKDKNQLTALQERAQGLATDLQEMSRRMQALQEEIANARRDITRIPQYDKIFEQFKVDLVAEMDRRETAYQKIVRESDQLRKVENESVNRAITEIRKELPRLKPLEDEVPVRRAEERRLSDLITRLTQRVDQLGVRTEDRVQTVVYLEEGRRQDAKRIAQLEEASVSLLKRIEQWSAKTVLLEENLQRMPPRIAEVIQRVQDQDKMFEEMRLNDFRRSQDIKNFMDEVNQAVGPIPDLVTGYRADHQKMQELASANQQSLDSIQSSRQRIEARQGEVAEMQRIAEERIKKLIEEWQTEQEKRWKRQALVWAEQWQEHDRLHEGWESRLEDTEAKLPEIPAQFKLMWEALDEIGKASVAAARQLAEGHQTALDKARPSKPFAQPEIRVPPAKKT